MEREERMAAFAAILRDEERSENTIDNYMQSLKNFFSEYAEVDKKNMLDFKRRQLETRSPKTANNRVIAMNRYCKFIGHPEYCVKGIKIHRSASVENVITLAEYEKLLEGLMGDGNEKGYWMVRFLAKTGARASEFVRLTKTSLDTGYCEMWTKGKIRQYRKNHDMSREYPSITFGCANCGKTVVTEGGTKDKRTRFCCQSCEKKFWKHPPWERETENTNFHSAQEYLSWERRTNE